MGEQILEYKPVVIGNGTLSGEVTRNLHASSIFGINVLTDSPEMHRCLQLSGASVNGNRPNDCSSNFYYLTQSQLPFKTADGEDLQQLQVEYPGDIYMSPDMNNFYFWGIDKLGTLVSMIYGIRAIKGVEEGKLGVHSALLYDNKCNCAHLLIGKNRIGKSTIGQMLEDLGNRFVLLSDDWSEINVNEGTVEPMSMIFSPKQATNNYEPAFESFGKQFYWKHGVRPYPVLNLGTIIELYGTPQELADNKFIQRSMAHIPLIAQPVRHDIFDSPTDFSEADLGRYLAFQQSYMGMYSMLRDSHKTIQVINQKGQVSVEQVTQQILSNI